MFPNFRGENKNIWVATTQNFQPTKKKVCTLPEMPDSEDTSEESFQTSVVQGIGNHFRWEDPRRVP